MNLKLRIVKEYWIKLTFVQKVKLIFFAVLGLLILIFALLNWYVYDLNLIFGTVKVPVTILILISMFGGYGYARVYAWLNSRNSEKEISYLKGELAATREKLRNEPPKDHLAKDDDATKEIDVK